MINEKLLKKIIENEYGNATDKTYSQKYINGKLIDSSGTGWIRYQDGTQICYGNVTLSSIFNSAWGAIWETPAISTVVTFPKAFKSVPYVTLQGSGGYSATAETINRSTTKIGPVTFWRPTKHTDAIEFGMQYIAIGRWK